MEIATIDMKRSCMVRSKALQAFYWGEVSPGAVFVTYQRNHD
jgi:hypothetical protein